MIPIEDLTDVTLAIEDTYEVDEDDEDDEENLTDVTLVSDDTYWRLDWCDPGEWWYLLKNWKSLEWWKLSSDESYQVMKGIKRWKV